MAPTNSNTNCPANRREFLRAAGAAAALSRSSSGASQGRPNVIVLLSDDQGYGDLSCHGNPVLKTPALDKLHGESVRFTDFHSAPMCTPTRGQLLSGQDALHNGATSVTAGRAVLRRGLPTMGDIFGANGYSTGIFGKWHVGDNYPYRPMDRGFQEAKYFFGWGLSSAPEFDNDYFDGRYRDKGVGKRFPGYCTDFWFGEAMKWMGERQRKKAPFLCYLPTNVPHGPAWVADKYSAPYKKPGLPAAFFGMIATLDENAAKLDAFLKETGLRENTILIFMGDNGGTAGVPVFNAGMRARKTQIYDGGHRVPCFVRWPAGGLRPPGDVNTPAQMQDVLPTLIDLCGLKDRRNAQFDGASLAGLLKDTKATLPDRMLVVQYGQILKKWDSCTIWGKWRLVSGGELYDIHADPGQKNDVAAQNAGVVKKMRDHYEAWWGRVEPGLREFQPISIGSEHENPVALSSSDWQEVYCDNVNSILSGAGGPQGGPWKVLVERDGEYEISLRRWPAERDLPLNAPCPEKKMTAGSLPAGKAMPIAGAKLTMAGQALAAKTAAADKAATFRLKLKGGTKTDLHAWFQDAAGNDVCGAYYAYVRRL
ncbi:MAG: arylsulfatase [Acidobacteria bacterium]|nr:arylsulfatase [Acidobacteriota bacterium]